MTRDASWICCQLGAREHYAVPRSMHRRGALAAFVTDAWVAPGSPFAMLPGSTGQRLRERYSPDLSPAAVKSFTASLIANEAAWRVRGLSGWPLIIARNQWFQSHAAAALPEIAPQGRVNKVVFAHSYAALAIFQDAKARGYTTVLGQIDPGETHFEIARTVAQRWPDFGPPLDAPPPEYFADWREECRLADRIVANSDWSREMLIRAGVEAGKIEIVGLPFESEVAQHSFVRQYPAAFTAGRPLRLLFVGSVATFKGVPSLLESLDLLRDAPIELRMVGPMASTVPPRYQADSRIRWVGSVTRSEVMAQMRDADLLVFPSHSDGFGMAQVEAQGWRLPIIASRSSGRVVEHGVNGFLLPEVSPAAMATAIRDALEPGVLTRISSGAPAPVLTLDSFGDALSRVAVGA